MVYDEQFCSEKDYEKSYFKKLYELLKQKITKYEVILSEYDLNRTAFPRVREIVFVLSDSEEE